MEWSNEKNIEKESLICSPKDPLHKNIEILLMMPGKRIKDNFGEESIHD